MRKSVQLFVIQRSVWIFSWLESQQESQHSFFTLSLSLSLSLIWLWIVILTIRFHYKRPSVKDTTISFLIRLSTCTFSSLYQLSNIGWCNLWLFANRSFLVSLVLINYPFFWHCASLKIAVANSANSFIDEIIISTFTFDNIPIQCSTLQLNTKKALPGRYKSKIPLYRDIYNLIFFFTTEVRR